MTTPIERALASRVERAVAAPWGSKNRTQLAELADGRSIVIQHYSNPTVARIRLHAAQQLAEPLVSHGVPVPRVLAHDLASEPAWAVFERLPGAPAYEAVGHDLSGKAFPLVAEQMGLLLRRMSELAPQDFDLPRLWTEPNRLVDAARAWLADLEPYLAPVDFSSARAILSDAPSLLSGRPPVVCHGDFGPQNVLVVGDRVSGLLDLEDARIADPLLDAAWWAWLVRFHTPVAFERSWDSFLVAAGIDEATERFEERLRALIVLRLLETADSFRLSAPEKHASWAERLSKTLAWSRTDINRQSVG